MPEPTAKANKAAQACRVEINPGRLTSLDAYRGFVMLLMMAEVLDLRRVAQTQPNSTLWLFLAHHQSHVQWIGCSLHDLIQPSFSFLVGVALPFSLAGRAARGESRIKMTLHSWWRAFALVLLGVFLRSIGQAQTNWTFEDTLSQIGLGYGFLFMLGMRPARDQWLALSLLLVGYWAAFALYAVPTPEFDYTKVGITKDWPHLMTGFAAHWNKNSNLGWAFDAWFLNLFPRANQFGFNSGGYVTMSFIPTLGTMILGLIAGGVLRDQRAPWVKAKWLAVAGIIGIILGLSLNVLGLCPLVKRIWTPTWVLFSGGLCFLLAAGFYTVVDILHYKRWAFPLVVIGMNSIAAYCITHLFEGIISDGIKTHLGTSVIALGGPNFGPLVHGALVLLVLWLLLLWMHRQKIFLRI